MRGIFWLGSASLVTRLFDIASIVVVLSFLTKEEMGVATLAWTVAVIIDAFNGLGIGTAILQTNTISQNQLSSSWWFTMGIAVLLFLGVIGFSDFIANYYAAPKLQAMIAVSGSKLLFVGAALIPIQMLNRELKFKEIGAVQTIATLVASLLKIGLAAAGFGAWALVIGNTAHGLLMALGAYVFQPFLPRLRFVFSEIKQLVIFGSKVTASASIYHFYRNADYLIVGRFLGKEALGVYRVAFDIAMTPALTLLNVVNRSAFPIFSRLSNNRTELSSTFFWVQKNFALMITPIALFLTFAASDLMQLIGKSQWIEASPAIQILVWAALFRCLAQVFPQLFHATGKPELAIYDSIIAMVLLVGAFTGTIWFFGDEIGFMSVCYAWVFSYPVLILFLWLFAKSIIPLPLLKYLSLLAHPVLIGVATVSLLLPLQYFREILQLSSYTYPLAVLIIVIGISGGYQHFILKLRISDLLGSNYENAISKRTTSDE